MITIFLSKIKNGEKNFKTLPSQSHQETQYHLLSSKYCLGHICYKRA